MCKVSHRYLLLFIHTSQERPLVIDAEVEDAVLVRQRKRG